MWLNISKTYFHACRNLIIRCLRKAEQYLKRMSAPVCNDLKIVFDYNSSSTNGQTNKVIYNLHYNYITWQPYIQFETTLPE